MEYFCVEWKKAINREKTKPQTAVVISCGFEVFLRVLNFILNGLVHIINPLRIEVFMVF